MALVYVIFWFCWIGTGGLTLPLAVGNGTGTPPIIPCTTVLNVGELESESQISKGHVEYNRRITFKYYRYCGITHSMSWTEKAHRKTEKSKIQWQGKYLTSILYFILNNLQWKVISNCYMQMRIRICFYFR